jgi:hypothetical protein
MIISKQHVALDVTWSVVVLQNEIGVSLQGASLGSPRGYLVCRIQRYKAVPGLL